VTTPFEDYQAHLPELGIFMGLCMRLINDRTLFLVKDAAWVAIAAFTDALREENLEEARAILGRASLTWRRTIASTRFAGSTPQHSPEEA